MHRRAQPRTLGIMRSIQAKLLTMLAVLSLPLLVVSLLQLDRYHHSMNEQAGALVAADSRTASLALENWLEANPALTDSAAPLPPALAADLYSRLLRQTRLDAGSHLVIRDARGRVINPPEGGGAAPRIFNSASGQQLWTDGEVRVTGSTTVPSFGWSIAVGRPPIEKTADGQSSMWLTSVWALALAASILIAVWASSRFTTPLRRLTRAATVFGEGELTERAVVETKDEVGTLAGTFNHMAESLQARFDELQTQSLFINEVLDNLPLGVAVLDDRLSVRRANSNFKKIVNRSGEALHGRGIYDAAAGLARLSEVVEDVRRTRQPFVSYGLPLELSAVKSGDAGGAPHEKFWDVIIYPTSGQAAGERGDLLLILNDVTDRVRAEKLAATAFAAERARAAELTSVISQMDDGVVIVDRRGLYRINPAAARILGRPPAEFRDGVAALIEDFNFYAIEGRALPAAETPLAQALDHGRRTIAERFKISRPPINAKSAADVEERVLSVSTTPLVNANDEREGAVAVFRDVTEEVTQHEALVAAYDRLREHDRLKSAFVANITHELRTPLNVIIGICQVLVRDRRMPLAHEQSDAVERMNRNARNLLQLVNNLIDYSRLEAGRAALHLETIDIAGVVQAAAKKHSNEAATKGVRFTIEIAPDVGRVFTDPQKLTQVVENLVGNAVKFTDQGEVNVRVMTGEGEGQWTLEVSDTGIGIPADEQQIIFDEFRQGDERLTRNYGGAGLGLALTRRTIELLGGTISVESAPEQGSRFRVVWNRNPAQRTGTGSLLANAAPGTAQTRTRAG